MSLTSPRPKSTTVKSRPINGRALLARSVLLQMVTSIGQWAMLVAAQTDAVYRLNEGGWYLAVLTVVAGSPLLASRLFGKACDHFGPRPLGLMSTILAAAIAAAAAFIASGPASILLFVAAASVPRALSQACSDTLPTWLPSRPSHTQASIWMSFAGGAPLLVGPSLAAALTVAYGVRVAFAACAVLAAIGTLLLASTPTKRPDSTGSRTLRIRGNRALLLALVAYSVTAFSYSVVEPLQPLYLARVVHAPPAWLAINHAAFGIASTTFGLFLARVPSVVGRRWSMACGLLAVGFGEAVIFISSRAVVSTIGNALFGIAVAMLAPSTRVRMLKSVASSQHGQMLGSMRTIWGAATLACTGVGPLTVALGPQAVVWIVAALLASTALISIPGTSS